MGLAQQMRMAQQMLVVVGDGSHTCEIGKEVGAPTPEEVVE